MADDLSSLSTREAATQGVEVKIIHPVTGEQVETSAGPMWVKVSSINSEDYRKAMLAAQNRRLAVKGRMKIKAEELQEEASEAFYRCVKAWGGFVLNGETLECNIDNVRRVFGDTGYAWMRTQVEEVMADDANFLKKSS